MPRSQFATCTVCHTYDDNRRWHAGSQSYLAMCRSCERDRAAARRRSGGSRIPRIPATRLGLDRKFGIEIECFVPGGQTTIRHRLPVGWRVKGDASLGDRINGVEIVSPPITGEDGLAQLKQVCTLLAEVGATVNRRCGLHVHHEARDIGVAGIKRFVKSWVANHRLIDWLVSPSRRATASHAEHYYCAPFTESDMRSLETWRGRSFLGGHRYRPVNLNAFQRYGTVEIRQHQGTLSFRKIEAWIKLVQGMLDTVAQQPEPVAAQSSLQRLFATVGVDEDTGAFFLGRALQFGAPATVTS